MSAARILNSAPAMPSGVKIRVPLTGRDDRSIYTSSATQAFECSPAVLSASGLFAMVGTMSTL
jgi:hypothetical protein